MTTPADLDATADALKQELWAVQKRLAQLQGQIGSLALASTAPDAVRVRKAEARALAAEARLAALPGADARLIAAARAFLACIDNITTDAFAHGADRAAREALRDVLDVIDPQP